MEVLDEIKWESVEEIVYNIIYFLVVLVIKVFVVM